MFDLQDCLNPDGKEWCFEEIRLRKMGMLGKKWGPVPGDDTVSSPIPSSSSLPAEGDLTDSTTTDDDEYEDEDESSPIAVQVKFNDQDENAGRRPMKKRRPGPAPGGGYEPTVTINTKAAMEDVFGMFNSPEKTVSLKRAGITPVVVAPLHISRPNTPKVGGIGVGGTPGSKCFYSWCGDRVPMRR
jgi:checkpoint serine/threonine-protein kinase